MNVLRPIVGAISTGLDRLAAVTGRVNDRFEAHWVARTELLRAHYARRENRQAEPLPVVDGALDLSLRGGVKKAA